METFHDRSRRLARAAAASWMEIDSFLEAHPDISRAGGLRVLGEQRRRGCQGVALTCWRATALWATVEEPGILPAEGAAHEPAGTD
jgi:hypothetical protein